MLSQSSWSLLATLVSVSGVLGQAPTAITKSGTVTGFVVDNKVKAFYGIPFAKPPVRFSPPVDAAPWTGPLKATKAKPACVQQFNYPEDSRNFTQTVFSNPMPEESEDCLYLNVWAPQRAAPAGGFPVMFWVFGGNLQFGTGSLPMYNGAKMADQQGVVVVTHNYRTNVFGFPGSPEIAAGSNNLGFLDQRKALDWTSKNIAAFGGNPQKVTLFGESAGGYSIKQMVAMPPKPPAFHAAIMQSQAFHGDPGPESWAKLVAKVGCDKAASQIECVRKLPAAKIKDAIERGNIAFNPIADEITFTQDVAKKIVAGTAAKIPIIMGTNADEGTPFTKATLGNSSVEEFIARVFGDGVSAIIPAIIDFYPKSKFPTPMLTVNAIFRDLAFQCATASLTRVFAENGYTVYRYYFKADFPENYPFSEAGAYHSAEIEPIFKTYKASVAPRMNRLSNYLQKTWAKFGVTPNVPLAGWPKVTAKAAQLLELGVDSEKVVPASSIDVSCVVLSPILEGLGL